MKTSTLLSALTLASAAIALPQAPQPPSYDGTGGVRTSPDGAQRPRPYTKNTHQDGAPGFQEDDQPEKTDVDAVPGGKNSGSGSTRGPRPQSYGQNNNVNVDQGGHPSLEDEQDQISPQPNRRPKGSNNSYRPHQNPDSRLGQSNDENMPDEDQDDQKSLDQDRDDNDDSEDDEDQYHPQQNRRPGQSNSGGHRGSIGGIGPGGIGSPTGGNRPSTFGPGSRPNQVGGQCVSQQEANQFVRRFIGILNRQGSDIGDAESTAEQIIADDYIEISSSINTLERQGDNGDTDSIAAESKDEWIEGMLNAPPFQGIQTLKVLVFCDQVVWYWNSASVGSGQFPVKGFNLFTLRRGGAQVSGGRPYSGRGGTGAASDVPTGSTIQCVKLEVEFDSLANALNTGFTCSDRDGNPIETSGGQRGSQGGMAGFQNNRPHDQDETDQDETDQDGDFQDFRPQASQGGRPGMGNYQSLPTSQRQGSSNGRNFDQRTDADKFDQIYNERSKQGHRGQVGPTSTLGGRLNANAGSLAGQANGGTLNEADINYDTNLRQTSRKGRGGAEPQDLASL